MKAFVLLLSLLFGTLIIRGGILENAQSLEKNGKWRAADTLLAPLANKINAPAPILYEWARIADHLYVETGDLHWLNETQNRYGRLANDFSNTLFGEVAKDRLELLISTHVNPPTEKTPKSQPARPHHSSSSRPHLPPSATHLGKIDASLKALIADPTVENWIQSPLDLASLPHPEMLGSVNWNGTALRMVVDPLPTGDLREKAWRAFVATKARGLPLLGIDPTVALDVPADAFALELSAWKSLIQKWLETKSTRKRRKSSSALEAVAGLAREGHLETWLALTLPGTGYEEAAAAWRKSHSAACLEWLRHQVLKKPHSAKRAAP